MIIDLYSGSENFPGERRGGYSALYRFKHIPLGGWGFDISSGSSNSPGHPSLYVVDLLFNTRSIINIVIYNDCDMHKEIADFLKLDCAKKEDQDYLTREMKNTLVKYGFGLLLAMPNGTKLFEGLFNETFRNGFQAGEDTVKSNLRNLLGV